MYLIQLNIRHLWQPRQICSNSKTSFSPLQWSDVPNNEKPKDMVVINDDKSFPLSYEGVTHPWGSNFRHWWSHHHHFEHNMRLKDFLDVNTAATTDQ